jgi:DNA-binding response OmpR family regulator
MEDNIQAIHSCINNGRKFGILVVDDEKSVREMLCYGMRKNGFRVWRASGGRSALKTYWHYRERIDVVLMDVQMPGLDGPQTLVRLRRLTTKVHCCFISGGLGKYDEQTLLDMGAVKVFRKPLPTMELAEALREIVTNHQLNPSFRDARRQIRRQGPVGSVSRVFLPVVRNTSVVISG